MVPTTIRDSSPTKQTRNHHLENYIKDKIKVRFTEFFKNLVKRQAEE